MIIIRTDHDKITHYLFEASKELIEICENKGIPFVDIQGDNISRDNVISRIKKHSVNFIFFNGHGSTDSLYDNKNEVLLNLSDARNFKHKIVYARACDCIKGLGKKSVQEGCYSFIGYKNKFIVPMKGGMVSRPLKDSVSQPVICASNLIVEKLLKGHTVKDAVNASHEYSLNKIIDLIYSKDIYAHPSLPAIMHNDQVLSVEGKEDITIT